MTAKNGQQIMERGFSLVEMVFALGVLVFAIFAIYSLLPIGLRYSRQARGDLRGAEIMASVAEDFRVWEKMTNEVSQTPFYGFPTGFDPGSNRFTTSVQSSKVIYQDGSMTNESGERYMVAVSCDPISRNLASRVSIAIIRGQAAQANFSSTGLAYSNDDGVSFASLIIEHSTP